MLPCRGSTKCRADALKMLYSARAPPFSRCLPTKKDTVGQAGCLLDLDINFNVFGGVAGLNLEGDYFASQGLTEICVCWEAAEHPH